MHFPEGTTLREIVDGFEVCWGFPQVAGAIDGTQVPVIKPQDNPSDYHAGNCGLLWTFLRHAYWLAW